MRKLLYIILLFVFFGCPSFADQGLRDYNGVELAKGTFLPVVNAQEISTAYCDEGTKVRFISTTDLYLYDTDVIPKNTVFYGYIEKLNEPVIGTNASMQIKVTKLKFTDGFEVPIRGYIYVNGSTLIGGELTEPETYDKKVSLRQGFPTQLGYVPGNKRKRGENKVIAAGADLIIVLTDTLYITHTVTN